MKIKMNDILVKGQQVFGKVQKVVVAKSPLMLTITGIAGLGATAYFAYKAAPKVELITTKLENRRQNEQDYYEMEEQAHNIGEENMDADDLDKLTYWRENPAFYTVDRAQVAKELVGAVALPVITGVASVASIILSYKILTNRLTGVAASLAAVAAENAYLKDKYEEKYGKEELQEFLAPMHTEMQKVEGKKKPVAANVRDEKLENLSMQWFDQSSEYTSDDHDYNMRYVTHTIETLQNKLFRKGWITLNEVRDAFGFVRDINGANVGWSTADTFDPDTQIFYEGMGQPNAKPQILIKWGTPRYIWDVIEYKE